MYKLGLFSAKAVYLVGFPVMNEDSPPPDLPMWCQLPVRNEDEQEPGVTYRESDVYLWDGPVSNAEKQTIQQIHEKIGHKRKKSFCMDVKAPTVLEDSTALPLNSKTLLVQSHLLCYSDRQEVSSIAEI